MKTAKYCIYLLIVLATFSCSEKTETSSIIKIVKSKNGGINAIDTESGNTILSGVIASFKTETGEIFNLDPGNVPQEVNSFTDKMGIGNETVFTQNLNEQNLIVRWFVRTFDDRPAIAFKLELENQGEKSTRIDQLNSLVSGDNGGINFQSNKSLQYLDIEPETWMPKAMKKLEGTGSSKFLTGIADEDNQGVVIGCVSFDRFRGFFEFEDQRTKSNTLSINTWHDIDDHLMLEPEGKLASEWIYVDAVNDILTGLEQWAELAGTYNDAVISSPQATGFYTWYYYRDFVSEDFMIENTNFLAENRDKFPVNFVHIDWGWQRQFSSGDTVPNEKFPKGLKWVADHIKDNGFTPSLWCNPFMHVTPSAEAPLANPSIFRHDTTGNLVVNEPIRNIMANAWGDAEYMISDGDMNVIDVSNPEAYDFLEQRYDWVRSTGYDMAMMDFIIYGRNNYNQGDRLKYSNVSTFEGIKTALKHAKKGLGPGGNILGCGTIYEPSVGVSNLTRISYDATANWKCVKIATSDLILQYYMNQRLWTNYADGLFVRDKASPYWGEYEYDEQGNKLDMFLTDDEAEFYTAVNGLSQAAVMYTEDVQRLKPERQKLLSMVLPIYEDGIFQPVDLFKSLPAKTLQLKCNEGNRSWMLAAGLNWTEEVDENSISLKHLDLNERTKYHVFDGFKYRYLGVADKNTNLGAINPHGVLLVNLVAQKDYPQIVGTDMHISQGGVEIKDETWSKEHKTLTIQTKALNGRKGHIYIQVPSNFSIESQQKYTSTPNETGAILKLPVILDKEKTIELEFAS